MKLVGKSLKVFFPVFLLTVLILATSASAVVKRPHIINAGVYFGLSIPYNSIGGDFDNTKQLSVPALGETIFLPDFDNGMGIGITGGIKKGPFAFELSYTRTTHEGEISSSTTDAVLTTFNLDGKYHFLPYSPAQPFITVGLCVPRLKVENVAEDDYGIGEATFKGIGFNVGGGLIMHFGSGIALTGGAVYRWVDYSRVTSLSGGGDIDPTYYDQASGRFLGGVDKLRDQSEIAGLRVIVAEGLPVLGICRGQQVLNVARGGTLYQDIAIQISSPLEHAYLPARPMEQIVHPVAVEPGSQLARILGERDFGVNSAHHQAVRIPGEGLRVVATAPDGVIEALELEDYPFCLSVQWHPEAMVKIADTMYPLFAAFVAAARGDG